LENYSDRERHTATVRPVAIRALRGLKFFVRSRKIQARPAPAGVLRNLARSGPAHF